MITEAMTNHSTVRLAQTRNRRCGPCAFVNERTTTPQAKKLSLIAVCRLSLISRRNINVLRRRYWCVQRKSRCFPACRLAWPVVQTGGHRVKRSLVVPNHVRVFRNALASIKPQLVLPPWPMVRGLETWKLLGKVCTTPTTAWVER